jgi:hypothetical protein
MPTETKQQTLAERVEEYLAKREAATKGVWALDNERSSIGPGFNGRFEFIHAGDIEITGFMNFVTEITRHGESLDRSKFYGPTYLYSEPFPYSGDARFIVAAANYSATLLREQGEEIERLRKALQQIEQRTDGPWSGPCANLSEAINEIARRALGGE